MRRFLAAAKPLPQIWKLGACMPGGRKKRGRLGKKLPKLPFSLQALVPMYRAWPGMVVEAVDAFFGKPWANVRIAIKLTYPKDGLQRRAAKLARLMDETREESWSPYIVIEHQQIYLALYHNLLSITIYSSSHSEHSDATSASPDTAWLRRHAALLPCPAILLQLWHM